MINHITRSVIFFLLLFLLGAAIFGVMNAHLRPLNQNPSSVQ